jgi:hypothetical protein
MGHYSTQITQFQIKPFLFFQNFTVLNLIIVATGRHHLDAMFNSFGFPFIWSRQMVLELLDKRLLYSFDIKSETHSICTKHSY